MSLEKYNSKRKFEETPEPKSGKNADKNSLHFVVQRHHASHLHYDFRLELDGVLKSWAVPKGPSLNPKDRRLAMMVEDHPYDYRTFEGEIPKGNYGAGTVTIFDEGTYRSLAKNKKDDVKELRKGLADGNLKFSLDGKILKGEFALVKIKSDEQNAWLLIKHNDDFALQKKFDSEDLVSAEVKKAGKAFKKVGKTGKSGSREVRKTKSWEDGKTESPEDEEGETSGERTESKNFPYSPMLAELSQHIFDDKDWIFERKLDGYRILATTGKQVKLITRNGKDYTETYPDVSEALKEIPDSAVLDGEILVEDEKGKDTFQALQHFEHDTKKLSLKYYVFDLLYLGGHDLLEMPLIKRKELLKTLLQKQHSDKIIYHDHIAEKGKELFAEAKKKGWEGVVAKKADSEYYIGKRSSSWLKFKETNSQEAIICGYTKPAGSRKYFGALVLGLYVDGELKYIGNCGTGFNDQVLKELHGEITDRILVKKPFSANDEVNQEKSVTWIRPELVCEVNYTEWTADGHLRHPVYKGLREDKEAKEVVEERGAEEKSDEEERRAEEKEGKGKGQKVENALIISPIDSKKLKLSNLEKLYWKKEKITKGDLLDYYNQVADWMLPYLKDKPMSLKRQPDGADSPGFFQKDLNTDQLPNWIKTTSVHSDSNNKEIDYLLCNDKDSLLWAANLGCIEMNPWLSSYKTPENPEFMVIDLDPDNNDFSEVKKVALTVKSVFDKMEIASFVKTTGSRGIHIYIYLAAQYDYDFIKQFAQYVAQLIHEEEPDITSIERAVNKRKGLIYIDYLQNRHGQTVAAPYSARPKPGATVSMPLRWDEVDDELQIKNFTIQNVPKLLQGKDDPWKDIRKEKADLKKALQLIKSS